VLRELPDPIWLVKSDGATTWQVFPHKICETMHGTWRQDDLETASV